jgi:hypothetical protein
MSEAGKRPKKQRTEGGLPPRQRPVKKKKKESPADEDKPRKPKGISGDARAASYGIGGFLFLLGLGMLWWFNSLERAPSKAFNLLAAGGVAALLSGIGLFISPLDHDKLNAFQNEPNPIEVFKVMPVFWKAWLLVILAAMIAAFVFVAQNTVEV